MVFRVLRRVVFIMGVVLRRVVFIMGVVLRPGRTVPDAKWSAFSQCGESGTENSLILVSLCL